MAKARRERKPGFTFTFLIGLTASGWLRVLRENGFKVSPRYLHRAVFITFASLFNSLASRIEDWRFASALKGIEPDDAPVFILGYWRSGTTLLHNLMALDDARFQTPTTFQAINAHTFLTTRWVTENLFWWMLPGRRPMDEVAMALDLPQEDEVALMLLSGVSPYFTMCFPNGHARYERYVNFSDATREEADAWKAALRLFIGKMTFLSKRQVLLKSPAHMARIPMLLELFPNAKFVHIHRHPYDVFRSNMHLHHAMLEVMQLQVPKNLDLHELMLSRYENTMAAYRRDRARIAVDRIHELSFEALERDKVGEIRKIYQALDLGGFEAMETKLSNEVERLKTYRKNRFDDLTPETKRQIARRWKTSFDEWGYDPGIAP